MAISHSSCNPSWIWLSQLKELHEEVEKLRSELVQTQSQLKEVTAAMDILKDTHDDAWQNKQLVEELQKQLDEAKMQACLGAVTV